MRPTCLGEDMAFDPTNGNVEKSGQSAPIYDGHTVAGHVKRARFPVRFYSRRDSLVEPRCNVLKMWFFFTVPRLMLQKLHRFVPATVSMSVRLLYCFVR